MPNGSLIATECTWLENSASSGGAIFYDNGIMYSNQLTNCTFAMNSATLGAGVFLRNVTTLTLNNTVIAFSTSGNAVACDGALTTAVLSCCDIFGNQGGDWTGCIADQLGINGCFAADPRFCNLTAGDLTLAESSPCTPAHSPGGCGLIGALPVGCAAPIGVADATVPVANAVLRVTPNPVRGDAVVEWIGPAPGATNLDLFDLTGRLLRRRDVGVRGAGPQKMPWSQVTGSETLASGVYFLEIDGGPGGSRAAARVLVVR